MLAVLVILIFAVVSIAAWYAYRFFSARRQTSKPLPTEMRDSGEVEAEAEFAQGAEEDPAPLKKASPGFFGFYRQGSALGFKYRELSAIRNLSRKLRMPDAAMALFDRTHLDEFLRRCALASSQDDGGLVDAEVATAYQLFQFRMDREMLRTHKRRGLITTRTLPTGQSLKLVVPNVGAFTTQVVENVRTSIRVWMPSGKNIPPVFQWKGKKIDVHFWRNGDAMYFFQSHGLNEPDHEELRPILHLSHSDDLSRTQKRSTIRAKVMGEGHIFPFAGDSKDLSWTDGGGFLCKIVDISELGAAIVVRGSLKVGTQVKLQTLLGPLPVMLSGEITSLQFNAEKKVSLLHLRSNPPSPRIRIRIMAWVLGFLTQKNAAQTTHSAPNATESESDAAARIADHEALDAAASLFPEGRTTHPDGDDVDANLPEAEEE